MSLLTMSLAKFIEPHHCLLFACGGFCRFTLFGIGWGLATFSVLLTFLLAIVAARVSGETGITPVGAMGKVTQSDLRRH